MNSGHHLLEINLISAQGLKPPPGSRRMQCYAVAWADPSAKVRTLTDRDGGENPSWNDRFVFLAPAALLHPDSPSALTVQILALGGWCFPDSLVGTVRLLVGNHHLLARAPGDPAFAAVGVRRPSGRFHGVLNVGATRLASVSTRAAKALAATPAISYRDLMAVETPRLSFRGTARPPLPPPAVDMVLKELNGEAMKRRGEGLKKEEVVEILKADGRAALCGLGISRRIHLSPSDQNLQVSLPEEDAAS